MASTSIPTLKACRKCGVEKPATLEHFVKKLAGLTARCRPCTREEKRQGWPTIAEKVNAARRANRSDVERARDRARYHNDPQRRIQQNKLRHLANPERKRMQDAASYRRNADKRKAKVREWSERNKDKKRTINREFYRRKRAECPTYRLRSSVSALIYHHLKHGKGGKRTEEVLGYSIAALREHLERQFAKGMTWDNYGDWHVDHILPVASFQFESADDPEFRACWALTNLRPLWATENIRKSDNRLHLI